MVKPIIAFDDVWKVYQMGEVEVPALQGINLVVNRGEFIVIAGSSGSGKSTMMNLIGCLDIPTRGKIMLDNENIASMTESKLAITRGQNIGFIFQQFNLIPTLNALDNVMLPLAFQDVDDSIARKRAMELLDIIGLKDRITHLPSQLSGGQMQRVAIARSLAVNPGIILADEPTGNLDSKVGKFIMDFLSKMHSEENKTVIVVTHDLGMIRYADRVIYLKDGKIEKTTANKKHDISKNRRDEK
ncbi:MAG: ABC transporter ATP-binding protein [Candidatus Aenigmarchaeota archaeon]|nr:ABC transporter ATP-binding protein [Candidatus Aenigmarchaeota archaeon]